MTTRSPLTTPRAFSALASLQVRSRSSRYVTAVTVPSSASKKIAVLSPRPCSTLRSRQLYDAFSVPSSNHLKNGALSSLRTRLNGVRHETISRASRAQNAWWSRAASSQSAWYAGIPDTQAFFTASAGGG
jgi:hypothetical protein